jgi:hypothetical protein
MNGHICEEKPFEGLSYGLTALQNGSLLQSALKIECDMR